ncbi:MAG: hypothetical protein EZS28_004886 [Streblomastix strix]|uniref:Uncharacterized protein n=1 Tax=Streblomastix strix TaxID=222440 RepID=A0A5J4WX04_9EUKA|nr:MAG: hypothetical protein EZS28_004886 [Streblomastix strix]
MYESIRYDSDELIPDQVTPSSDTIPLVDSCTGAAGASTSYAGGDHVNLQNISDEILKRDFNLRAIGTATSYSRSEHLHILSKDQSVANKPAKDTGTGAKSNFNYFARSNHQHPLNVDLSVANESLVNAAAAANAQATDVLLSNGDSKPISDVVGDGFVVHTGKTLQVIEGTQRRSGDEEEESDDEEYLPRRKLENGGLTTQYPEVKILYRYIINAENSVSFAGGTCGAAQINPNGNNYNQVTRISGSSTDNYGGIFLCCNPISTVGTQAGQRSILASSKGELRISVSTQVSQANQGLIISADGNTLSFKVSVIAGTGANNVATNGSINYSACNFIL